MATATGDDFAGLSAKETINAMGEDKKKALKSWYFFDWANQAYALTVMTVIAPALMAALYNTATGTQSGDTFYAWVLTISMILLSLQHQHLVLLLIKCLSKRNYSNGILWLGFCSLLLWVQLHISVLKVTLYLH